MKSKLRSPIRAEPQESAEWLRGRPSQGKVKLAEQSWRHKEAMLRSAALHHPSRPDRAEPSTHIPEEQWRGPKVQEPVLLGALGPAAVQPTSANGSVAFLGN